MRRVDTTGSIASAVLVVLFGAGPPVPAGAQQNRVDDQLVSVELSTIGVDGRTGTPIVLLREPESETVLPIWIGPAEAQAIALALHGVVVPRPMTHDLMASLLAELRADVAEVVVHDLRNNTYFGVIRLQVPGEQKLREVDSRPSDALALALRTGAPIRVARKILASVPEFEFVAPEGPNQIVQALGVTVVSATRALRDEFKLGEHEGVVVTGAFGRAYEQGIRRGDLIIEVNGKSIHEPVAFFDAVRATPRRQPVRVTYRRGTTTRTIELPADVPAPLRGKGRRLAV